MRLMPSAPASAQARAMAVQVLNQSAAELLSTGGVTYDRLMNVTTDSAGQVRLIQANTPEMNRLASAASLLAQEKLLSKGDQVVKVPLGSALGLTIFGGAGPKVAVRILPVGSVHGEFHTDFQTAGINQTRHRISLTLTAAMQLVIPTGAQKKSSMMQNIALPLGAGAHVSLVPRLARQGVLAEHSLA